MVAGAEYIKDIEVRSVNEGPFDAASVMAFISTQAGDEFDRAAINKDVKSLHETGRFSYVQVNAENGADGVTVVYEVKTRPRLQLLVIEGCDKFSQEKIKELLGFELGDPLDKAVIQARLKRVERAYRKKFYTDVQFAVDTIVDESAGTVEVTIAVDEGSRSRIRAIEIQGNNAIDDGLLRRKMRQKVFHPLNPLHWLTGRGRLDRDKLRVDNAVVEMMYKDMGYLDVKVTEPVISYVDTKKHLHLTYSVDEGPQYEIADIAIEGVQLFDRAELLSLVNLKEGETASASAIQAAAQALEDYYGSRGYIRTRVDRTYDPDPKRGVIGITFDIREGRQTYLRNINIRGNLVTKDKVIRRELIVYPGDLYNSVNIRRSRNRLMNLGYFSKVVPIPVPTEDPDYSDLDIILEEQRTGQMGLGAGFSSVEKFTGYFEISQGNFDIASWPPVGGGQKVSLRTTLGSESQSFRLSFTEPWLFNRKLALDASLFSNEKEYLSDDYNQKNQGGRIGLSRMMYGKRVSLSYGLENIDIYSVSSNASELIASEEGARLKSYLTLGISHDSRDSYFLPTRGNRTSLTLTYAGGPLSGDTDIYSMELRTSQHWPVLFDHTLNIRGRVGVVDTHGDMEQVPLFERFFLGGAYNLRGFDYRSVGPVDENNDAVGGRTRADATVEYSIPIVEKIRFAAFYDVGMVWEDAYYVDEDLNSDYGIGIRLDIPMMPLRFDYAWPIEADEHNDTGGQFNFRIGYSY